VVSIGLLWLLYYVLFAVAVFGIMAGALGRMKFDERMRWADHLYVLLYGWPEQVVRSLGLPPNPRVITAATGVVWAVGLYLLILLATRFGSRHSMMKADQTLTVSGIVSPPRSQPMFPSNKDRQAYLIALHARVGDQNADHKTTLAEYVQADLGLPPATAAAILQSLITAGLVTSPTKSGAIGLTNSGLGVAQRREREGLTGDAGDELDED
jgi:hypothetical protein